MPSNEQNGWESKTEPMCTHCYLGGGFHESWCPVSVAKYIDGLHWDKSTDAVTKLYIAANIRGFSGTLEKKEKQRRNELLTTQESTLRKEWAGNVRELEEIEKAAKPADDEEKLYEFGYLVACKQIRAIIEPDSTK